MTPEKRKQIASKGGRSAHAKGVAHTWDSKEAAAAGKRGGLISRGGKGRKHEEPDEQQDEPDDE